MNPIEEMVREFHARFGLPASDVPVTELEDDVFNQRVEALEEEKDDLVSAEEGDDLIALAKESVNVIYAAVGNLVALGFPLDIVFQEVHRSNMSKAPKCTWCNGEKKTQKVGGMSQPCTYCGGQGYGDPVVEDGKIIKPGTYEPANLEGVIENYCRWILQG